VHTQRQYAQVPDDLAVRSEEALCTSELDGSLSLQHIWRTTCSETEVEEEYSRKGISHRA